MKPSNFILSSDYGTLKNDSGSTVLTVTINNGFVFNPSNPLLGQSSIEVGTLNAPVRSRMTTTKRGGTWIIGTFLFDQISSQVSGFPVDVSPLWCSLYRTSPSTMTLRVETEGFPGPNITIRETVVVSAIFTTFLSPLD